MDSSASYIAISGKADIPRADWDRAPWNRWTFQHVREMVPTAQVWRGAGPVSVLSDAHEDIDGIGFEVDGRRETINEFLEDSHTDGFLIVHRGRVIAERYMNGMAAQTQHLSQSVAKSVVGTVAGILITRGALDPSAPVTHYLPALERTAYRGAKIQHVLDMTSGVVFDETYTAPASHIAQMDVACGWKERTNPDWPGSVRELIMTLGAAECAHGASFRYRSIETDVLALAMERASGMALAELVAQELWAPMGAEEDAYFTVDPEGYALANGGFNACLRDYARFAWMMAKGGEIGGRQVVPAAWIEATRAGDPGLFGETFRDTLPEGAYHNQFWIEDPRRRVIMARGVFGQLLYIDPEAEFAAVKLSSWPVFLNSQVTRRALAAVRAIRQAL